MAQSMDEDIKKIACMITELDGLAYSTYKPIVEDICTRKASESEVEHILDYMVGMCNSDRMLELFKRVCRKYIYLYPEMITSEIYTYKDMYEGTEKDWSCVYIAQIGDSKWVEDYRYIGMFYIIICSQMKYFGIDDEYWHHIWHHI